MAETDRGAAAFTNRLYRLDPMLVESAPATVVDSDCALGDDQGIDDVHLAISIDVTDPRIGLGHTIAERASSLVGSVTNRQLGDEKSVDDVAGAVAADIATQVRVLHAAEVLEHASGLIREPVGRRVAIAVVGETVDGAARCGLEFAHLFVVDAGQCADAFADGSKDECVLIVVNGQLPVLVVRIEVALRGRGEERAVVELVGLQIDVPVAIDRGIGQVVGSVFADRDDQARFQVAQLNSIGELEVVSHAGNGPVGIRDDKSPTPQVQIVLEHDEFEPVAADQLGGRGFAQGVDQRSVAAQQLRGAGDCAVQSSSHVAESWLGQAERGIVVGHCNGGARQDHGAIGDGRQTIELPARDVDRFAFVGRWSVGADATSVGLGRVGGRVADVRAADAPGAVEVLREQAPQATLGVSRATGTRAQCCASLIDTAQQRGEIRIGFVEAFLLGEATAPAVAAAELVELVQGASVEVVAGPPVAVLFITQQVQAVEVAVAADPNVLALDGWEAQVVHHLPADLFTDQVMVGVAHVERELIGGVDEPRCLERVPVGEVEPHASLGLANAGQTGSAHFDVGPDLAVVHDHGRAAAGHGIGWHRRRPPGDRIVGAGTRGCAAGARGLEPETHDVAGRQGWQLDLPLAAVAGHWHGHVGTEVDVAWAIAVRGDRPRVCAVPDQLADRGLCGVDQLDELTAVAQSARVGRVGSNAVDTLKQRGIAGNDEWVLGIQGASGRETEVDGLAYAPIADIDRRSRNVHQLEELGVFAVVVVREVLADRLWVVVDLAEDHRRALGRGWVRDDQWHECRNQQQCKESADHLVRVRRNTVRGYG
ncbi:hypothetical protein GQR58_030086 [Nymphon striatum]|nr:hypothetical protein GQR58_030086 [Nymphon striatum]